MKRSADRGMGETGVSDRVEAVEAALRRGDLLAAFDLADESMCHRRACFEAGGLFRLLDGVPNRRELIALHGDLFLMALAATYKKLYSAAIGKGIRHSG